MSSIKTQNNLVGKMGKEDIRTLSFQALPLLFSEDLYLPNQERIDNKNVNNET